MEPPASPETARAELARLRREMLASLDMDWVSKPEMRLLGTGPYDPAVEAELTAYLQARLMRRMLVDATSEKDGNRRARRLAQISIIVSAIAAGSAATAAIVLLLR